MTSDILYTGDIWQDEFVSIGIACKDRHLTEQCNEDYISKFILVKEYKPGHWYPMEITKTFVINNPLQNVQLSIYLATPRTDEFWNPDHTVLLKNIKVNVSAN